MLGSITPLGERGRGSTWWLTTLAYVAASTLTAAILGASLGTIGALVAPDASPGSRLLVLGAVVLAGLALDLGMFGVRLPGVRRQVDERWRARYRGWVWGVGYGAQLGVGVVTIVTTSTVYATWAWASLSGDALAGLTIGAAFGLARALPVLSVAGVRRPDQLLRVDAVLGRISGPARRATYAAGAVLATTAIAGAVRW
jgi:Cytochrome C biogenesis protein transmembrane region